MIRNTPKAIAMSHFLRSLGVVMGVQSPACKVKACGTGDQAVRVHESYSNSVQHADKEQEEPAKVSSSTHCSCHARKTQDRRHKQIPRHRGPTSARLYNPRCRHGTVYFHARVHVSRPKVTNMSDDPCQGLVSDMNHSSVVAFWCW